MRPSPCRTCLAFLLKVLNFLQAFVGVAIIVYSVWMLNHWSRHDLGLRAVSGVGAGELPDPWFVYSFMGVGVLVCLVTFSGHVAAEAVNGCCLCFVSFATSVPCYAILTSILILFEAALVGLLVIDKHWEEDLPHDPTGELDRLRKFVEANIDVCRWIGVVVIVIQALSLLLAVILRGLLSTGSLCYDSDEDLPVARTPLLYPNHGSGSASKSMDGKIHSDIWSARMREKYGLSQGEFSFTPVDAKPPSSNPVSGDRAVGLVSLLVLVGEA
ncbi:hypothetical protein Taro_005906 [Colocasia esculenta]|uniref:Tetraspanin-18 n=1 Tax=Colocasia esculenta TaxID=4460 RepID=A0A843TPM5_COLES|nr:hypothetical protein [Colocasia esculenta]